MRNESGIDGGKQTTLWSKVVVQPHLYILMKFSYSISKKKELQDYSKSNKEEKSIQTGFWSV